MFSLCAALATASCVDGIRWLNRRELGVESICSAAIAIRIIAPLLVFVIEDRRSGHNALKDSTLY